MGDWNKKIKSSYRGVYYRVHPSRIYRRQKDKYFIIRYYKGGKRIEEGLGWLSQKHTADEANEIRTTITSNIKLGKSPQSIREMREMEEERRADEALADEQKQRENITFGVAAEMYLEWSRANKKSYEQDKSRHAIHLKERFDHLPMKNISAFPHLETLKRDIQKKKLADATLFQVLQEIRAIYRKATEWGLYSGPIPTENTKNLFPKINNKRVGFLSPDQANELLRRAKEKSLTLYCQCVLALHAGLRFGEIAALEWSDINVSAGTIHIRNPKSGRDRHAYINEAISEMLDELIEDRTKKGREFTGLIFPDTRGRLQKHVSRSFYECIKDMGLNEGITDQKQRISFHSLRHTFGSQLAAAGFPILLIQELMGHQSLEMTSRYSHFAPGLRQDAAKALGELFKGKQNGQEKGAKVVSIENK